MNRLTFLNDHFSSVKIALDETLRYDYKPEQRSDFFSECESRLGQIKTSIVNLQENSEEEIAHYISELNYLSNWICLIERSHLGEFSWPFSEVLKSMADEILTEEDIFKTKHKPIVNIVSEGDGYRITYENSTLAPSSERRFVFVVFPRPLKHHVLLHTIFGHELCHTAFSTSEAGRALNDALSYLIDSGPLKDLASFNVWLHSASAPASVQSVLSDYSNRNGAQFLFSDDDLTSWRTEFLCDLYGLLLFGPGFIPAHNTIIAYAQSRSYEINESHPIFEARRWMLLKSFELLCWNLPTLNASHGQYYDAELHFLSKISESAFPVWVELFSEQQLDAALKSLQSYLQSKPLLAYSSSRAGVTLNLLEKLAIRCPPIYEILNNNDEPEFDNTHIGQTLYAGWLFWYGQHIIGSEPLSFSQVNQLCDHALLQQAAIKMTR